MKMQIQIKVLWKLEQIIGYLARWPDIQIKFNHSSLVIVYFAILLFAKVVLICLAHLMRNPTAENLKIVHAYHKGLVAYPQKARHHLPGFIRI